MNAARRPRILAAAALACITLAPLASPAHAGPSNPRYDIEAIARYYESETQGLIRPAPNSTEVMKRFRGFRYHFERTREWGKRILPEVMSYEAIYSQQDAFALDVPRFIGSRNAPDLLTAKNDFYSGLNFSPDTQLHDRPYSYLYSWGTLFHPPIKKLTLPREKYARFMVPQDVDQRQSVYFDPEFQRRLDLVSETELTYGNHLKLLPNHLSFAEKLRLIRESKNYLFTSSLLYVCDDSTLELVREMVRAKERGVRVHVVMEGITDVIDLHCSEKMTSAGLNMLVFSDVFKKGTFLGVMHNKIWIRDGEEAIVGGQNILEAQNRSDGFNFRNRDTDVLLKAGSPSITDLTLNYVGLWNSHRRQNQPSLIDIKAEMEFRKGQEILHAQRGRNHYEAWLSRPETRMNGICRVATQPSGADSQPLAAIIHEYIRGARQSVWFNSPTMEYPGDPAQQERRVWNDILRDLILKKAKAGTEFQIVSNGIDGGNGELAILMREVYEHFQSRGYGLLARIFQKVHYMFSLGAARTNREMLLKLQRTPRIHTHTYFNYNHSKTYIFDRIATGVGSFNFDLYSSELSHESMIFCLDKPLLQEMEDQFLLDLINSVPVTSQNGE